MYEENIKLYSFAETFIAAYHGGSLRRVLRSEPATPIPDSNPNLYSKTTPDPVSDTEHRPHLRNVYTKHTVTTTTTTTRTVTTTTGRLAGVAPPVFTSNATITTSTTRASSSTIVRAIELNSENFEDTVIDNKKVTIETED